MYLWCNLDAIQMQSKYNLDTVNIVKMKFRFNLEEIQMKMRCIKMWFNLNCLVFSTFTGGRVGGRKIGE